MVINSFIYFSNEIIDSVKNVNVTLSTNIQWNVQPFKKYKILMKL